MGNLKKKKYGTGEAANYITRKQAMKKLQLSLKDFRRLCILKGIHPREPRNRKRAQKGDMTKIQTLFHEKDIRFLIHEPIVWKFRDFKVFMRKFKKAKDKGNRDTANRLVENKPKYTVDHIVKERYPTFVDAIRDLEDCLCLCFLYATFPKNSTAPVEMVTLCRKLTIEFMHYVIESKCLRKVFVSIKGYYYQAEIMGQTVTWIVPHKFSFVPPSNVDIRLMSIFVEFYTTMLGFVNFRLFHNLNIKYPPALQGSVATDTSDEDTEEKTGELIAALNQSLVRTVDNMEEDGVELDDIPTTDDPEKVEAVKKEALAIKNLQSLFKGLKFFLNREVPRESLVFMIRAFGGEVSWDATMAAGSTFAENDETITHQICDRSKESVSMTDIKRYYIQPQWVFDSINRRELVPVHDYFVGKVLPPHLSPFMPDERRIGDYIPPEEQEILGMKAKDEAKADEDQDDDEEDDEAEEEAEEEEDMEESDDDSNAEEEEEEAESGAKMSVEVGKTEHVDVNKTKKAMDEEEMRLRKMMIKNKHRGLYRSMMKARKKRVNESRLLERKRQQFDASVKEDQKAKAKAKKQK